MSSNYNAKLIADLYATSDWKRAIRLSDEMVEIGDNIFPRQIYEAYKKFQNTTISHYFVSDLTSFKTSDAIEILKEIAHKTSRSADISMMVDYFIDIGYFESEIVVKVKNLFRADMNSKDIRGYDIETYSAYLKKADKETSNLELFLRECFEDEEQEIDARKTALEELLKLKPKEYINFYYDKYDSIKGKKTENIFVEQISTWHGGIVPKLHQKILEIGSERAKEILQNEQSRIKKEKQSEEMKEQEEIKRQYETADVLHDIGKLRLNINKTSIADERFGFSFFSQSEEIYQQVKPAKTKNEFVGCCIVLRSFLNDFDKQITELKISEERGKEILPNIEKFSGNINKFHFMLKEKGLNIDQDIFGLRNINCIVSKFAHPGKKTNLEINKILKKEVLLFKYYKENNWSALHREVLLKYKKVLEELMKVMAM
ncbi:MAG: hypothetical protein WC242_05530 [Candidatus Paceibacterota bacterium]|jgi:hypothetical protein